MLTKADYDMLDYLKTHQEETIDDITAKLGPGSSARMNHLLYIGALSHKGMWHIRINDRAHAFMQDYENNLLATRHRELKERRRYIITTSIAVLALIKSFLPELLAIWQMLQPMLSGILPSIDTP